MLYEISSWVNKGMHIHMLYHGTLMAMIAAVQGYHMFP